MLGKSSPDLSELAYHIISLCDFWNRSNCRPQKDNAVHVISKMIGIFLGIEDADRIARAVITELDFLKDERVNMEVDPEGIEVVFISSLLHEQMNDLAVPATTAYWSAVFDSQT